MNGRDVVLHQLQHGQHLIEMFTKDLTDAEYFKPPIDGGNHVAWSIGHLAVSEDWALTFVTGGGLRLPKEHHEVFKGGSKCVTDSARYPSRKAIDELFLNQRAYTIEMLKKADLSTWTKPAPEGAPKELFPTIGSVWCLNGTHQLWHIGQIAVCRQAMKKKSVLF